jgi:hypothetical protein
MNGLEEREEDGNNRQVRILHTMSPICSSHHIYVAVSSSFLTSAAVNRLVKIYSCA